MTIEHPYIDGLVKWASGENAIRALVVTGSLARRDGTADAFSDLDVQIIASDIKRYTDDDSWLDGLGEVWIRFPMHEDVPYRLVWFRDGIKVDFQFLCAHELQTGQLTDEYKRGYLVLLDKDSLFRRIPPSPRVFPPPPSPTAADFHSTINEFWFEAIHVAQFIRRRDFWVAKHRDWTMKTDLLRMLEWHARATSPQPVNTWLLGKRIAHWTDEETYNSIQRIWGGWDATELWTALLLQLDLFRRLSREVALALRYSYEDGIHRQIEAYIRRLRSDECTTSPTD